MLTDAVAQRAAQERQQRTGRMAGTDFDLAPFTIAWEVTGLHRGRPDDAPLLRRARDAGVRRIALSLDAPSPEVHDDFRKVAGSWERTMAILRSAQELGISTQINTTVTTHNVDLLEETVTFVREVGAVQWSVFSSSRWGAARHRGRLPASTAVHVAARSGPACAYVTSGWVPSPREEVTTPTGGRSSSRPA